MGALGMNQLYRWVSYHWVLREKRWALQMLQHVTKQHQVASCAAKYWMKSQLLAAFETWHHLLNYMGQQEIASADHCLMHWMNMQMAAIFSTWYRSTVATSWARSEVYRAVCLWRQAQAAKGIIRWQQHHKLSLWMHSQIYR